MAFDVPALSYAHSMVLAIELQQCYRPDAATQWSVEKQEEKKRGRLGKTEEDAPCREW